MEKVRGRAREMARLLTGNWLSIADIDEALFPLAGIVNYSATLTRNCRADRLEIVICSSGNGTRQAPDEIIAALEGVRAIGNAVEKGSLVLEPIRYTEENRVTTCAVKRAIIQRDEKEGEHEPGRTHNL